MPSQIVINAQTEFHAPHRRMAPAWTNLCHEYTIHVTNTCGKRGQAKGLSLKSKQQAEVYLSDYIRSFCFAHHVVVRIYLIDIPHVFLRLLIYPGMRNMHVLVPIALIFDLQLHLISGGRSWNPKTLAVSGVMLMRLLDV